MDSSRQDKKQQSSGGGCPSTSKRHSIVRTACTGRPCLSGDIGVFLEKRAEQLKRVQTRLSPRGCRRFKLSHQIWIISDIWMRSDLKHQDGVQTFGSGSRLPPLWIKCNPEKRKMFNIRIGSELHHSHRQL